MAATPPASWQAREAMEAPRAAQAPAGALHAAWSCCFRAPAELAHPITVLAARRFE
jgi:hypothetical protein